MYAAKRSQMYRDVSRRIRLFIEDHIRIFCFHYIMHEEHVDVQEVGALEVQLFKNSSSCREKNW